MAKSLKKKEVLPPIARHVEEDLTPRFMVLQGGPNPITVGVVPIALITFRRANYRKMNQRQRETLQAGIDRLGFQTLLIVVKEEDGTYGLVDGHHRLEELKAAGATMAPVICLPEGTTKEDADLGMLSLNVSAELDDVQFGQFISDLMSGGTDSEEIRKHGTLSAAFMDQLQEALDRTDAEPQPDTDLPTEVTPGAEKQKKSKVPDLKVVVLLAVTEPEEEGGEPGKAIQDLFLCPKSTILSAEVREALEVSGFAIDEVEAAYFEEEGQFMEMLTDRYGGEEEGA